LYIFLFSSVSMAACRPDSIPASTPDSQLTDNGDYTISDKKTGLMWKKCVEGVSGTSCNAGSPVTLNWQQALDRPGNINSGAGFAGYTDWRLPNIKELSSIVERQCTHPAINLNRFPNTLPQRVWSSSPHHEWGNRAWDVHFGNGGTIVNSTTRETAKQVRLVRGGQ